MKSPPPEHDGYKVEVLSGYHIELEGAPTLIAAG